LTKTEFAFQEVTPVASDSVDGIVYVTVGSWPAAVGDAEDDAHAGGGGASRHVTSSAVTRRALLRGQRRFICSGPQ
jgi:hypothetical protein